MMTAMTDAGISCCGKKMKALQPQKADENEKLMVAMMTGDSMLINKQYPEWELQVRIPVQAHGRLFWYCNRHGLFYMES